MGRLLRACAVGAVLVPVVIPGIARASNVEEFPDNGSEQEGRGGAWVARASDPLAAYYNPAGLAGQPTRLTIQANLSMQHMCFSRVRAAGDPTVHDGADASGHYPQVCNDGSVFPNPQIGFTWHATDRLGIGLLLLGPSGVGSATWPSFINGNTPSPQRYMLLSSDVTVLTPTIGAGYEVADGLRLGVSFEFGIAPKIDYITATPALNEGNANTSVDPAGNDVRAELLAKQTFIPGFTLGGLWSPGSNIDVGGWFKWSAPIDADGDLQTAYPYFTPAVASGNTSGLVYGDTSIANCNQRSTAAQPAPNLCGAGNNAHLRVPIPMEAKLGFRYHAPRADVVHDPHRRDPMADDVFDVEADFTWANDSAFDYLQLRFPGDANGNAVLPANPNVTGGKIPSNADIRHHFRDVFGVRVGGDYNVLPDRLAIRAGAFVETRAADPTYLDIDFDGAQRIGLSLGGTYRIPIGERGGRAIDLMLGYGHVFFATLDNSNPNAAGLNGLAGTACNPPSGAAGATCPNGNQKYRTNWPINLGTLTDSINVINLGASYRF